MVKRRRPPQWHLLFTGCGLLAAMVVAVSVSDLPSLPATEEPTRLHNLQRPHSDLPMDAASLTRTVAARLDSVLSDLGIPTSAVTWRSHNTGSPKRSVGPDTGLDSGLDTIGVRVPVDLPVASVNGALTEFITWHGGHVVRGQERRGPGAVHLTFGIDSTVTTLFRLRRDRSLRRNSGDIALVVDVRDAPASRIQRLSLVWQALTLAGGLAAQDESPTAGAHQRVDEVPDAADAIDTESVTAADVRRRLWALAERAANDGAVVASLRLRPATLDALEQMLPRLERRGYRFVTLAELDR